MPVPVTRTQSQVSTELQSQTTSVCYLTAITSDQGQGHFLMNRNTLKNKYIKGLGTEKSFPSSLYFETRIKFSEKSWYLETISQSTLA